MSHLQFRAWDKNFNVMIPQVVPYDKDNIIVLDVVINTAYPKSTLDKRLDDVEGAGPEHYSISGDIEVMQCTGLKDMNGVDIYEGDILKDGKGGNGVVVFISPQFVVNSDGKFWQLAEGKIGLATLEYTEIVGNIYQNPELISL